MAELSPIAKATHAAALALVADHPRRQFRVRACVAACRRGGGGVYEVSTSEADHV
jgi:hypothetical protein